MKPVGGAAAVRRVSTSEKKYVVFVKGRANKDKKKLLFAFFWFFSFAKEKNTHPSRPPRVLRKKSPTS